MEHQWTGDWEVKTKVLGEKPAPVPLFHCKSLMDYTVIVW
jgi:hypothetical protein